MAMYTKEMYDNGDVPFGCGCGCHENLERYAAEGGQSLVESGRNMTVDTTLTSGDSDVDGIFWVRHWAGSEITYSFPSDTTVYDYTTLSAGEKTDSSVFLAATSLQETAAKFALDADVAPAASAGFTVEGFTQIAVTLDTTPDTTDRETIRIANTTDANMGTARVGDFPASPITANTDDDGDVWFGPYASNVFQTPQAGNYAWTTMIHELGHALGLTHSHQDLFDGAVSSAKDWMAYSVMSYRSYEGMSLTGYTNETWGYAQSWMQLDIRALQEYYGADFTVNSGNTTYKWNPGSGDTLVDGAVGIDAGGNRIFATIWDGNGTDTYDLSAYTTGVTVDLRPGEGSTFSSTQQAHLGAGNFAENIYNALLYDGDVRSLIENAIGGSGNDTFIGNQAANAFTGGLGTDTVDYSNETSGITVDLTNVVSSAGGAVGDTFNGIENIVATDQNDIVHGSTSNNQITLGGGDDTAFGSAGTDTIAGGTGIDTVTYQNAAAAVTASLVTQSGSAGVALGDTFSNVEILTGSSFNDDLTVVAGGTVNGGSGDDTLRGSNGAANMNGDAGVDTFIMTSGAETVDGGTENDKVDYSASTAGVTLNLTTGAASGGDAAGDTLTSIENADGSAFADTIVGTAGANTFNLGDGNDTVTAGGDNDTADGGDGFDTAIFSGNQADYTIVDNGGGSWSVTHNSGGADGADTYTNFERFSFADGHFFTGGAPASPVSDFDGDGGDDLLLRGPNNRTVSVELDGGVRGASTLLYSSLQPAWDIIGLGDFNGDSTSDILMEFTSTGRIIYTAMDAMARTTNTEVFSGLNSAWEIRGVGDYDADGDSDFLLHQTTTNRIVSVEMDGGARVANNVLYTALNSEWSIKTVGDFDNDGDTDIVMQFGSTGRMIVTEMNDHNRVTNHEVFAALDSAWETFGAGDFDADGDSDLLLKHSGTGRFLVVEMEDNARVTNHVVQTALSSAWNIRGIGDYDADGDDDILLLHATTGRMVYFEMENMVKQGSVELYSALNTDWDAYILF